MRLDVFVKQFLNPSTCRSLELSSLFFAERKGTLNVLSMEVGSTSFGKKIALPAFVDLADLERRVLPAGHRRTALTKYLVMSTRGTVALYAKQVFNHWDRLLFYLPHGRDGCGSVLLNAVRPEGMSWFQVYGCINASEIDLLRRAADRAEPPSL